jgi:small subunit ribosomal protein S17
MADDEKNDETPDEQVPGTSSEGEAVEAPDQVPGTEPDAAAEAEEQAPEAEVPEEQVPGTSTTDEAAAAPEEVPGTEADAPAKPARSRKHVPRSQRRTRPRPKREPAAKRKPITRTPKPEGERGRRQERRGVVVSDKGEKTIVVKVDVTKSHPRYKKVVRRSVKFHAHDEQNTAGIGDTVRIVETRPLSKTKRWRLAEVVEKAK